MTVSFKCPHCDSLCAFVDKYAGRRARCQNCQKRFIIPSKSNTTAEKAKEDKIIEEPLPGFYRAWFVDSWYAMFEKGSLPIYKHLAVMVILKNVTTFATFAWLSQMKPLTSAFGAFLFIIECMILSVLSISLCAFFGRIVEIYMLIIEAAGFDAEELPPPLPDKEFPLWKHMLKPFFVFMLTIFASFFPFFIIANLFSWIGLIPPENSIFELKIDIFNIILQLIFLLGLFSIPITFITVVIGADISLIRPDVILSPIFKNLRNYLSIFFIFGTIFIIESLLTKMPGQKLPLQILIDVAVQIPIIWAMWGLGLYYINSG